MMRETDSGSSIPKLLASFKIKMARRRASLILVPVKVRVCAAPLRTLSLHKNCHTLGSDSFVWWSRMCHFTQSPNPSMVFQLTQISSRLGKIPQRSKIIDFIVNYSLKEEFILSKHWSVVLLKTKLKVPQSALLTCWNTGLGTGAFCSMRVVRILVSLADTLFWERLGWLQTCVGWVMPCTFTRN